MSVAALIARAKNVEAIFECESVVRSMFGTTNTQETPGNRILDINTVVFKINCAYFPLPNLVFIGPHVAIFFL
jgi:hypothetical protein